MEYFCKRTDWEFGYDSVDLAKQVNDFEKFWLIILVMNFKFLTFLIILLLYF